MDKLTYKIGVLLTFILVSFNIINDYLDEDKLVNEKTVITNDLFDGYTQIEVYGGDLSGDREANVVVDIGFGNREYWAFTNEYGQLVRVVANKIILQDDEYEDVNSDGRYYDDEAKVPGVESRTLDEGHVIADSLGGVANAYNITPQDSYLNRHGDQAYMEKIIREAGGCTNFEAIITYPNDSTQVPSSYTFRYTINGEEIEDVFLNMNPEELGLIPVGGEDITGIDTNNDGIVTVKEAKAAGFSMPITKDDWLYKYMNDGDGDGLVGE